ncbi:unnamed protein product [Symbiodinium sp. CCMP2592]|nr:unnamed protein product [Symbiodinium sp. CCMP2592]
MADFTQLVADCNVPAAVASLLSAFDIALFARSCTTAAELEELVNHFLAEASVTEAAERFITKASLRLLFCKCRTSESMVSLEAAPISSAPLGEGTSAATPAPTASPPLSSSWQEAWPAKLSGERTAALRKRFEEDYPTELLDAESFPRARLLALTNKMLFDKEVRWIPWKYRLSARAQEDSLLVRPRKQARFDLTELFLDEAPTRDIHEGPASFGLVTQLLSLAANAIALCQGAHLGSLKLYNKRFMRICFTRYEAAARLRGPTTMEAQAADRRCWEIIADLVNVHHWKLDDALHEVAEVRSDMHSLLAPRPFIPKPKFEPDNSWKARFTGNGRGGKGGGRGGKGRDGKGEKGERFERGGKGGKGKDNKQSTPPGKWLSTLFMDGKHQTLCMRYQSGQCKDAATCRYLHRCAVPKSDGTACSAGATLALPKARAPVSCAASALSEGSLDFATCLELLAQYFSSPFTSSSHCPDKAIAASEAYFNLGAFAFGNGARRPLKSRPLGCLIRHSATEAGKGELRDTWHAPLSFSCESLHCTMPIQGDRWVLTAYTCKSLDRFDAKSLAHLRSLGFPLPSPTPENPQPIPPPLKDTTCVELFLDICCGAAHPLTAAMSSCGITCLPVDLLGEEQLDLLNDDTYDHLLRLCFSGIVRLAHGSPPCKEYSRLKLRPGGPPAIRSPEHLNGLPGNTASQQARVESSQKLLYRCVCLLRAAFCSGAHVSLEQPTNAMSWLEPFVQDMLSEIQASLVNIPACSVGEDIAKSWLFACSYSEFRFLAGTCSHAGGHQSVAGARDEHGNFLSQRTAEYPSQLAENFSVKAVNLFSSGRPAYSVAPCSLKFALAAIPKKPRSSTPTAAQDGGGIYSLPDWSLGPRYQSDCLHDLRREWQSWLLGNRIPLRLQQHIAEASNKPLFSEEETEWLRSSFKRFSDSHSPCQDWNFSVKEGQPYCLSALERLSTMLGDKDTSLFPALQKGVPTGFDGDIPRSHTLRPRNPENSDEPTDLLVCEGNWQGAEADPALLQELIEEEVSAGYIEEVPSLEAAYERWGQERVAVGRVNIVKAPGRAARLVIDNSMCSTNQNCHVPEQFSLPSLQDIQAAYPPREDEEPVSGFSLDVKGVEECLRHRLVSRKQLDKLLGLLQWILHGIHAYLDDKLRFTESSRETLAFFAHLSSRDWRPRPLRPPPTSSVESAADAFGKGNDCGVGGWLLLPNGRLLWFAHRYTVKDFLDLGLPMQPDANLDISSYETLAQCFVLLAFWKAHGSGRLALTLPALSDNSGAESVCNKLYTSKVPLNLFVRKLSMWSSITGVTLDCRTTTQTCFLVGMAAQTFQTSRRPRMLWTFRAAFNFQSSRTSGKPKKESKTPDALDLQSSFQLSEQSDFRQAEKGDQDGWQPSRPGSSWKLWDGAYSASPTPAQKDPLKLRYDQVGNDQGWWNVNTPVAETDEDAIGGELPAVFREVQRALTQAKKADTKVKRLRQEASRRKAQFEKYEGLMKKAFVKQRTRSRAPLLRVDGGVTEKLEAKRAAAAAAAAEFGRALRPFGLPTAPTDSDAAPSSATNQFHFSLNGQQVQVRVTESEEENLEDSEDVDFHDPGHHPPGT